VTFGAYDESQSNPNEQRSGDDLRATGEDSDPYSKPFVERAPSREVVSGPSSRAGTEKRHAAYEAEVLNLLFAKRQALGIQEVIRFRSTLIDGGLVLADGRMLAVEIKLRMNWAKACQSGWQIRQFMERAAIQQKAWPPSGAVVFFEEFSGDWARSTISRGVERGWEHWYRWHAEIDKLRVDLVRVCKGRLDGHPLVGSG
jgi:hypothetical protein